MSIPRTTENTVREAAYTGARARAADFGSAGELLARGGTQLAQGVSDAGQALDKINEMYDTAAVKRADTQDLQKIMEIRAQALSAKGFDAQDAIANARKQIGEIKKERMAALTNPRQQRMYADVFDARSLQLEEQFTSHATTQVVAANIGEAAARADRYVDLAVDTPVDDPAFKENLDTALRDTAAANPGVGPDVLARARAKITSNVYSRKVEGLLSDPEKVLDAKDMLDDHAADILPEDETKLRKALNPLVQEQQDDADLGRIMGTLQPGPEGPTAPDEPPAAPADEHYYSGKPVSPTDPTRGVGHVSNTAAQHRARGSGNALDIAAPPGTPIHPPMSGKVIKNWWSKEGGWSVLIQHPNGYVTGYAHMRSKSALAEGQEVEADTTIGGVGNTGSGSHGNHVHYTVRLSAGGAKVDPNAVDWGHTVDPKSVSWKEPQLVTATADKDATQAAIANLNNIAAKENWSQRRYDRVLSKVVGAASRNEALYNKQEDALYNTALQAVVNLGEGLTSRAQVPGFGNLDPQHQITIDNIIKRNLKGPTDEEKTGGGAWAEAQALLYTDRQSFAAMSSKEMLGLRTKMSSGEWKGLYNQWLALNNDPKGAQAASLDDATAAARRYLPKDIDPKRRELFTDRYMEEISRRQAAQKTPLTPQDRDQIARSMTVEAVRYTPNPEGRTTSTKGYLFEYQPGRGDTRATVNYEEIYSRIPVPLHNQIVEQLKREGKRHSKQDVVRVYLRLGR